MLYGRGSEQEELAGLAEAARASRSAVLVVRGPTGSGKSALLDDASPPDTVALRTKGVVIEADLPYAGLQLLLSPLAGHADRLPDAQAAALRGALGLAPAPPPDGFLVGIATSALLAEASRGHPVLCLVDDADLLDDASRAALLFAARRLEGAGTAIVFATGDDRFAPGLPELRLGPLPAGAAESLVDARVPDLPPHVRRRVRDEAEGNPLTLITLAASLTAGQRAGRIGPLPLAVDALPAPDCALPAEWSARLARLPESAQAVLLVAAADGTGDVGLVLRAAARLGAGLPDLVPAERLRLIRYSSGRGALEFGHPLLRMMVYQAAPYARRVDAHLALAAALDAHGRADLHAWHFAAAATGPDEVAAAALAGAALRGPCAASSAALERAAELTADPCLEAGRLVAAADLAFQCGDLERADALAARASRAGGEPRPHADCDSVRASVELERGATERARQIIAAGVRSADRELAVGLIADTIRYGLYSGDAGLVREANDGLRAIGEIRLARELSALADLLGVAATYDFAAMRAAVALMRAFPAERWRARMLGALLSLLAGDDTAAYEMGTSVVAYCRERGMTGALAEALTLLAHAQMLRGAHLDAVAAAYEALTIARDIRHTRAVGLISGFLAGMAAVAGDERRCRALAERASDGVVAGRTMGACALGLLCLGQGRPRQALDHLAAMWRNGARHPLVALFAAPDLVEAAVRAQEPCLAGEPLAYIERCAAQVRRPWALALAARSRALVSTGEEAEQQYIRALQAHESAGDNPFQRARTKLLYGEWLRRQQRRADARTWLRAALTELDGLGAAPWSERARAELDATGEVTEDAADRRAADPLTPRERQVIRLAALGLSNREIGARLYLSHRTVAHHLYRAFPKIGVSSRQELAGLAPGLDAVR